VIDGAASSRCSNGTLQMSTFTARNLAHLAPARRTLKPPSHCLPQILVKQSLKRAVLRNLLCCCDYLLDYTMYCSGRVRAFTKSSSLYVQNLR
jgi:hypothetical protein